jgi:ABC-2 type transport system permease protein
MRYRKYLAVFQTALANQWAYSADVIFRSFFFLLILTIFMELWRTALGPSGSLAGFTGKDMVWYLVYTEAIMLAFPRFDEVIADEVKSGEIAYRLLKPMSYLGFHLSGYLAEIVFRFTMNVLVGGALVTWRVGAAPNALQHMPALMLVTSLSFVLSFQICAVVALLAFWVEDTKPFFWIYHKLMFTLGGLLIPNDVMPFWLKRLSDVLPFGTLLYAPARLFVRWDEGFFWRTAGLQLLWILSIAGLAEALCQKGVRRLHVQGG